jgi:hypothetical protein
VFTFNCHIASLASMLYCQPSSLVEAKNAFVIDFQAFTPQQGMNAPIAKAATFRRQLNHSPLQLLILRPHLGRVMQDSA